MKFTKEIFNFLVNKHGPINSKVLRESKKTTNRELRQLQRYNIQPTQEKFINILSTNIMFFKQHLI